ncbi:MAG: hypothetical protein ACRCSL_05280, partial [Microbacterium sp.]
MITRPAPVCEVGGTTGASLRSASASVEEPHDLDREDHHDGDAHERDGEVLARVDQGEELGREGHREDHGERHEHRPDDEHLEAIERAREHGEDPDADDRQDDRGSGPKLLLGHVESV